MIFFITDTNEGYIFNFKSELLKEFEMTDLDRMT